ncbi:hypothetical protein MOX02_48850 [Methylobacterium oxalidis]|uniref:Uncharacterized protein n=2 Tax=Methylobacterium oxalidis TaxID=944322 RepID=A0A512JA63_9HYPH|nr:hypothetical protein MOX02_48850 [Methylobacterium oxalidis]GLS67565.1 hypothetical protein GCM10007888_59490 [Methylobacterium oxalidis]
MVTADDELALVRPTVVEAVQALRDRGLSQMRAYQRLGGMVGKSPTWVRGIVGRDPNIGVRLRDALNIRAAYDQLCARVEAAAEKVEAENNQLREAIDVALSARATPVPSPVEATQPQAAAPRSAGRAPTQALRRARAGAPVPADQPSLGVNDLPLWRAIEGE